jgi:hypothetical protein
MLDQSFSQKSFREIFDIENRKGNNIEKRFKDDFSVSLAKTLDLKRINKQIREENDFDKRKELYTRRKAIKKERNEIIDQKLEEISNQINQHCIKILNGKDYGGQSYKLEDNVCNFFISKKIQKNIRETYKVRQSSRYAILSQLINLLEDNCPKYVIRTDIKNFYESIPQKILLEKINNDYLLSIKTKKFINQILESYNGLTGQTDADIAIGVPRGIGISAYLSELFMRNVDNQIQELDDIIYYARYVDDIIAIFVPQSKREKNFNYKKKIEEIVENEKLSLNEDKTETYNLLNNSNILKDKTINYLGYEIGSNSENEVLDIKLSEKKLSKYFDRIKLSFEYFSKKRHHNRKREFKLLSARIKYLTSNTKLRNNKDKVFVGIFYSNPFLKSVESLERLQKRLNWYTRRAKLTNKEKQEIEQYSFIDGFKYKSFQVLPLKNKIYKNHNRKNEDTRNENNSGILQFGITEITSIWKEWEKSRTYY